MEYTLWNDGTELFHYGVRGQKWGVRRYQNEDGTYTEEGRRRYYVSDSYRSSRERMVDRERARLNRRTDKKLAKIQNAKNKDMSGFTKDALKNGIRDKNGRLIATSDDVKQWKQDTAAKYDRRINDVKRTAEYRNKTLDIQRSMSNGRAIANDIFASTGYNLGSKTYASLIASGYDQKQAQRINLLLGGTFGQMVADVHAKKTYGIDRLR